MAKVRSDNVRIVRSKNTQSERVKTLSSQFAHSMAPWSAAFRQERLDKIEDLKARVDNATDFINQIGFFEQHIKIAFNSCGMAAP